jgi:hypothetical protein
MMLLLQGTTAETMPRSSSAVTHLDAGGGTFSRLSVTVIRTSFYAGSREKEYTDKIRAFHCGDSQARRRHTQLGKLLHETLKGFVQAVNGGGSGR